MLPGGAQDEIRSRKSEPLLERVQLFEARAKEAALRAGALEPKRDADGGAPRAKKEWFQALRKKSPDCSDCPAAGLGAKGR